MTADQQRTEIARMKRINRIGAFILGAMCLIVCVALARWLLG